MTDTRSSGAVASWFAERVPQEWRAAAPTVDREEITVYLTLDVPEATGEVTQAERAEAVAGRIGRFREETRERRIGIAREAEHRFGRKVAWGVVCGEQRELFTHLAVPVMTRLRQPARPAWPGRGRTRWPGVCAWWGRTPRAGWATCAPRSRASSGSATPARAPRP